MTSSTTHAATKATTPTSAPEKFHITTNVTYSDKKMEDMLDCLEDIELFMILIFIQIAFVLCIKIFKMCMKAYQKHNEIVIKKHSRTSPQL